MIKSEQQINILIAFATNVAELPNVTYDNKLWYKEDGGVMKAAPKYLDNSDDLMDAAIKFCADNEYTFIIERDLNLTGSNPVYKCRIRNQDHELRGLALAMVGDKTESDLSETYARNISIIGACLNAYRGIQDDIEEALHLEEEKENV